MFFSLSVHESGHRSAATCIALNDQQVVLLHADWPAVPYTFISSRVSGLSIAKTYHYVLWIQNYIQDRTNNRTVDSYFSLLCLLFLWSREKKEQKDRSEDKNTNREGVISLEGICATLSGFVVIPRSLASFPNRGAHQSSHGNISLSTKGSSSHPPPQ